MGAKKDPGVTLARAAIVTLEDKLAQDVVLLDLREVTTFTDYAIVVTGGSTPHLKAMSDSVSKDLKHQGQPAYRRSGTPESGWMLLDYVDVVIHIFSAEKREYYSLETLWEQAPRVS
jgi:ribosome-associated protein